MVLIMKYTMKIRESKATNISRLAPYLSITALTISELILMLTGNIDLAKKSIVSIGIPVILASLIVLLYFRQDRDKRLSESSGTTNILDNRYIIFYILFIIIYTGSIVLLVSDLKRPISYFLLLAILGLILFLEAICLRPSQRYTRIIIIAQTMLVLANQCFGITFKYPLFFGRTDMLIHMDLINTIMGAGFVTSRMGDYQYFPLFHILNSILSIITELGTQTEYYIFSFFVSAFAIILVYLICRSITKNENISIMAAILFSFSRSFISSSSYVITSTTTNIACMLILYLLITEKRNVRLTALSVFLIIPLLFMHQISLIVFLFLLVLILLIELFFGYSRSFSYRYLILLLGASISYWVYLCGPFIDDIIRTIFAAKETIMINTELEILPTWTALIRNLDYAIMIFTTLFAAFIMVSQRNKKLIQVFGLLALILLPLNIQDISNLFTPFVGYRFPMYINYIIIIVFAIGFHLILSYKKDCKHNKIMSVAILILVSAYLFSSPILAAKSFDFDKFPDVLGEYNRLYFTEGELNSFSFCLIHKYPNSSLFSDYYVFRYINGYLSQPCSCHIDVFDVNRLNGSSYFIFRKAEYTSSKMLSFSAGGKVDRGFANMITKIWKLNRDPYPPKIWSKQECIYNNEQVVLYYKN